MTNSCPLAFVAVVAAAALAFSAEPVSSAAASPYSVFSSRFLANPSKRSVNFTPSWGKRSMLSPLMSESMEAEADEHEVTCAARRAVVELLAQRLKAEMAALGECEGPRRRKRRVVPKV